MIDEKYRNPGARLKVDQQIFNPCRSSRCEATRALPTLSPKEPFHGVERFLTRRVIAALGLVLSALLSEPASAVWIIVPDASQVQYQTNAEGLVYFRNLDQFDSANALGCCYNYWIDTKSNEGKIIYAMFLSYIAQAKPFRIGIPDGKQPGLVGAVGSW